MTPVKYRYFRSKYAISVHDSIIRKSGGLAGTKDKNQLESILNFIRDDSYYPELVDKVSHLFYSINKGHVFNDGNKRTSIALSAYLLDINGCSAATHYHYAMEEPAVWLASGLIGKGTLKRIIYFFMYEDMACIHYFVSICKELARDIENDAINKALLNKIIDELLTGETLSESAMLDIYAAIEQNNRS